MDPYQHHDIRECGKKGVTRARIATAADHRPLLVPQKHRSNPRQQSSLCNATIVKEAGEDFEQPLVDNFHFVTEAFH